MQGKTWIREGESMPIKYIHNKIGLSFLSTFSYWMNDQKNAIIFPSEEEEKK